MEKPKHNSPIEDKIKWLEWFIANTTEEERQAMSVATPRERKCNDGRGRKSIYTPEEAAERKKQARKNWEARKRQERIDAGEIIKKGPKVKYTKEELIERQRQRCRERYHRLKANK